MPGTITPSAKALAEALQLAEDLLRGIELDQTSLTNSALRASRLARLLNEFE